MCPDGRFLHMVMRANPLAPQTGRLPSAFIICVTWRLLSPFCLFKQANPHKAIVTDVPWTAKA